MIFSIKFIMWLQQIWTVTAISMCWHLPIFLAKSSGMKTLMGVVVSVLGKWLISFQGPIRSLQRMLTAMAIWISLAFPMIMVFFGLRIWMGILVKKNL